MGIKAQQVITKARRLLVDLGADRWADPDLLGWLNSGQREIVMLKPNSNTAYVTTQLVAGTVQSITGVEFIEVIKNMGQFGNTPGPAVQPLNQNILDGLHPGWHTMAPSINVKYYMPNKKIPKQFMVHPPQPAIPGYVQILQAQYPGEIELDGNILDDIYETPLIDYIVARAFGEDTEVSDFNKSSNYMQRFTTALGGKAQAESISQDRV
jgi:hypothetical protein